MFNNPGSVGPHQLCQLLSLGDGRETAVLGELDKYPELESSKCDSRTSSMSLGHWCLAISKGTDASSAVVQKPHPGKGGKLP